MKRLLRALLLLQLRRPKGLWVALAVATLLLGLGVRRVERRLDLMSLLPTEHPVVKASLEAGVGRQELLWLAAEGTSGDLEARRAWAEALVGRLLEGDGVPLNGLGAEGRLASPVPLPGPKGAALWPPLLAAGSLVEGDAAVGRLVTEQFYALAPALLGERLAPLRDPAELRRRLGETARDLASPDPVRARSAQMDPLRLRNLLPEGDPGVARATAGAKAFPLRFRSGYLETRDGRFVLLPLVVDFPSGDGAATARLLAWLGEGAGGPLPARASRGRVLAALAPREGRAFALQATGAHAIAYWESQRLGREVVLSLALSFVLIGLVYWVGFRTLAGYGFVVLPLLLGMLWALGLVGWSLGRLNLMAAAFGAVLLGVGDDVGILLFSRYRDERQSGRSKALALRAALLGTGPGVVAGAMATALAFLACAWAPFPGFRDLGFTAGVGLLACMASAFLLLPALLLAFDRGRGPFAPRAPAASAPRAPRWKPWAALALVLVALVGAVRLRWEEDLRRFRQAGNPALLLQARLGERLGAGLQPLALQLPLDDPARLPQAWNRCAAALRREGLPLPLWAESSLALRGTLGSETWVRRVLDLAAAEGLDPVALERPLQALRACAADPGALPRSLEALLGAAPGGGRVFTVPLRLPEAAQDRVEAEVQAAGGRLVGTRPLFRAVKEVARRSLLEVVGLSVLAVGMVVACFGRRLRFGLLALVPLLASQAGVLGSLGWSGEPLTFLSLVAIPIALGVSVDVSMNLLHRARLEPGAAAKVARVNAVCAGTTLAGFGGLVFSAYRPLRGLGLAALGGTALALLATQWLLPWMVARWPLRKERP